MTPDGEFETLFHAYQQPITAYLDHLTGDTEQAEDLAQDAFLRAYRALLRGEHVEHPKAWLYRIATNVANDRWRRARLLRWLPLLDNVREPGLCVPDHTEGAAEQLAVQSALARLQPGYRVPLVLHLCEGLSIAEISEVLGIRQGAVKMRLSRAREQFRQAFQQVSDPDEI
jgi:RNA polymerase sigma-70 factor (ECF subfamily)